MVSPIAPVFEWKDGKLRSPAEVAREQRVAEALMFAKPQATGFWGALGQIGSAASGSLLDSRADASEQQGREAAANLFSGLGSGASTDAIAQALMSPEAAWASPAQSGVAEALLQSNLRQSDPAYQLDLAYKQAQLAQLQAGGGVEQENFFGNPIAFQGPDGSIQYGQIGQNGTFKPIDLPEGSQFAPNTRTVDTGTELLTVGPGGEILERIQKQNEQEAFQTNYGQELGTAAGQAVAGAPGDITSAQTALALVDSIANDPEVDWATGADAPLNSYLLGTSRFGFEQKVTQAKAGAFLAAIESLRGMGALSNAEGQTAIAAITRLNTGLSPKDFRQALGEYRAIVARGMANAQRRLEKAGPNAPSAPLPPQAPAAPEVIDWTEL